MEVTNLSCRKRKRPLRGDDSLNKESPYYSGFMGNSATGAPATSVNKLSSDPRRYVKCELPWPPADVDNPYATENEYSYIAEIQLPAPSTGQPAPDYSCDPPKYFVLDPYSPDGRSLAPTGERYVAPENQVFPPKRRDMGDVFSPNCLEGRSGVLPEHGYAYHDKADYNHLSV